MDHSLENRITEALELLSAKQKQLARFILDNKNFVSFATASQIGEKTDTSAATVVRFAQNLGYEGFSELQADLQGTLPTYITAIERIRERLTAPPPTDDIPEKVFYTEIKNIEQTANNLSRAELDKAVQAIVRARRIFVVASGLSSALGLYFAHSLKVIGFDARMVLGGGMSHAVDLSQLQAEDLLIAIDVWRYIRSNVDAVTTAKNVGAQVITITDSIVSPLSALADCAFEAAAEGAAHSLSSTAAMSLINVIIAMLSFEVPEQTMESLRRVDASYRDNHLLITR